MSHLFDAVSRSCLRHPERDRLTFLHSDQRVEAFRGGELVERAEVLAGQLQQQADAGERVLLAYPAGLEFVVGFLGCLRAGLVPVPVNYPKPRRPLSRYAAITSNAQAKLALTSQTMLSLVDPSTLSGVRWFSDAELVERTRREPSAIDPDPAAPAFLQYTSGSTSEPKGVIVTHENLLANLEAIDAGFGIQRRPVEERVVCSWLPAYHDMGLVGVLLASLVHDGHAVMISPTSFLQKPLRWLRAMQEYRATITVAPCFGYQWAAEQVDEEEVSGLDLSTIDLAACGAEPIFPHVLDQFARKFAAAGFRGESFYPCYGLAESTLMVTGTDRGGSPDKSSNGRGPTLPGPVRATVSRLELRSGAAVDPETDEDALQVVSSGVAAKDTTVIAVDTRREEAVADNVVGEIWVRSPSVAAGYWRDQQRTHDVFQARLKGDSREFLRTGDLGFLRDGQLFVTGRSKDLIIIGGQNHYPQDIEQTVARCHPSLNGLVGAAFSVTDDDKEQLVVVQEVPRDFDRDQPDDVLRAIRVSVARDHELATSEIVLIRPASLPKTSSGKVRRSQCRELFERNELKEVVGWKYCDAPDPSLFPDLSHLVVQPDATEKLPRKIESGILSWLKRYTGAERIEADQTFAEIGVDSLMAVELSQQLEAWLDVRLSPVAAWSYPNPAALAHHLSGLVLGARDEETDASEAVAIEDLLAEIESLDEDAVEEVLRQAEN